MADSGVPYQSLYRRFRPQRFAEVLGQDNITKALRNAVREGRVGHGYLFSGPRGTGKTSTARILAKALNCEKLDDGEPCGVCESCVSVQQGTNFAVFEMDAASNRGIDAVRDLIQRIALGGPGLRKVYIIDEVHHLTTEAATALLKTLEEPPGHVVFVLATTDPQKVLPTIKSRVQHYEFRLMPNDVLQQIVSGINDEAALGLDAQALERVVRRGAGSARDALSVLDQAAALGAVEEDVAVADEVVESLCERDPGRALAAVATACTSGRDPRRIGDEILAKIRDVFLAGRAPTLVDVAPDERERLADQATRLGAAALVRAMERLGEALTDMREALDARITLEVALVRITAPEADTSTAALLERIERLERGTASAPPPAASPAHTPPAPPAHTPPAPRAERPAQSAQSRGRSLGSYRRTPPADRSVEPEPPAAAEQQPTAAADDLPSRDELTLAWGDDVLPALRGRAKALFAAGRFVDVEGGAALFALPDDAHRSHCLPVQKDVEAALAAHFGRPVPLRLVAEKQTATSTAAAESVTIEELGELEDAPGGPNTPTDRVKLAFPGATEVEE